MPRLPGIDYSATESEMARFMARFEIDPETGCWNWNLSKRQGYGVFRFTHPRRCGVAHRVAYVNLVGPVPENLELDHLCRNRACCNPAHLEPVTTKENLFRVPNSRNTRTHCPRGHEYTPENTKVQVHKSRGYKMRSCSICFSEKQKSPEYKKKAHEHYMKTREKKEARRRQLRAERKAAVLAS